MPGISRKQITRKQVQLLSTLSAWYDFHPEKIFYMGILGAAKGALCFVKMPDLLFKIAAEQLSCF